MLLLARSRGALVRAVALALMVLALANPSFTREDRDPIPRSPPSSSTRARARSSATAPSRPKRRARHLVERLNRIPGLEVRVAEAGKADGETDGTRLFSALASTLGGRAAGSRGRRDHDHRRPHP